MGDKIFLIIGNGINIDLCNYLNIADLDFQNPFQMKVLNPIDKRKSLLKSLIELYELYKKHEKGPNLNDYQIINTFLSNYPKFKGSLEHSQLRLYLSLTYATITLAIREKWKDDWFWQRWFNKNSKKIIGIISFNYDLILETLLKRISVDYHRISSNEEDDAKGIPIFKPHGSSDFRTGGISISDSSALTFTSNRVQYIKGGKGRVNIAPEAELLSLNRNYDIVLPGEFSPYVNTILWVNQGYARIKEIIHNANYLLIIGSSYAKCDRSELNYLIYEYPKNRKIRYVNRRKNFDLETILKKCSTNYDFINAGILKDFSDIDCVHDYKKIIDSKHYYILKCKKCNVVDRINKQKTINYYVLPPEENPDPGC